MSAAPTLAWCRTCNARERPIVAGRCVVCGRPPGALSGNDPQADARRAGTEEAQR